MKLSDFDYTLPEKLIAQYPLPQRQACRLMVIDRKKETMRHDFFSNITEVLPRHCRLVLNNSKVMPVRLLGQKATTGAKFEIFLLRRLWDGHTYQVLMRPLKRVKKGDIIKFNGSKLTARIMDIENRIVRFNRRDMDRQMEAIGHMPLPPYIRREDNADDRTLYQTVYARHKGSVAAPTAGLHFTKEVLGHLRNKGHKVEYVTLHINYATFKPVEVEDISQHNMHHEQYSVSPATWQRIKQAKVNAEKIMTVGTTSTRVLESVALSGQLRGDTNLFISPGFDFKIADVLLTNFHLPKSTLLMLVSAFAGTDLIRHAYAQAIRKKYRFFSYGDAMVIL